MSKRGRRTRTPRGPHADRYAAKATAAQQRLTAFNADWEKKHPGVPVPTGESAAASDASEDSEGEEVA